MNPDPVLVICMGVSGSGKSTLAREIARQYKLKYHEADDFHSRENRQRMAAGQPLSDAMREPWIESMCAALKAERSRARHCVLAYSGLKRKHRQRFRELGFRTVFLHLVGGKELIAGRLQHRQDHFATSTLLDSQFEDMEATDGESDTFSLNIENKIAVLLEESGQLIRPMLGLPAP